MSREIKYRAWLKEEKKMVIVETIDFSEKSIQYLEKNEIIDAYLLRTTFLEDVELMQYTGQKDDYGNEIFENDFIIDVSEDGEYFLKLIGFGNDEKEYSSILTGFKIIRGIELDLYFDDKEVIFKGSHSYLLEKYKIKIEKGSDDEWIYFQIIGNKHENPELLELLEE